VTESVLDSSAILATLLGEPGKDEVDAMISDAVTSAVNISEVVGYYARNGTPDAAIRQALTRLKLEVFAFDEEQAFAAGALVPSTRAAGLSLGDRACLALARSRRAPAVTADRKWLDVASAVGVEVRLIR
jgi:ribonuclease VapC